MSQLEYIRAKVHIPLEDTSIGANWWRQVTLPAEQIPECSLCLADTQKVRTWSGVGGKGNTCKVEPDCSKRCIWFDWFDARRRLILGCRCNEDCNCLQYVRKTERERAEKEREERERKEREAEAERIKLHRRKGRTSREGMVFGH
jgi:hypothetical protein